MTRNTYNTGVLMTFAVKNKRRFNNIISCLTCCIPKVLQVPVDHLNGFITEQYFAVYFTSTNKTTLD